MPQEFHVLRCFSCSTFQVHIVKKSSNKWQCKMCNEKQSLKQVFGQGTGVECRQHVQRLNSTQFSAQALAVPDAAPWNSRPPMEAPVANYTESSSSQEVVSKWTRFLPPDSDSSGDEDPLQMAMRPSMPPRPYKPPKPRKRPAPPPEQTPKEPRMQRTAPTPEPEVFPQCPVEPDKSCFRLQTSATAVRRVQQPAVSNKWGQFLPNDNRGAEKAVGAVAEAKKAVEPPKAKKWSCFLPVEETKQPVKAKSTLPAYLLSTETLNDDEFDALFTL